MDFNPPPTQDDAIMALKASAVACTLVAKRLRLRSKRGDAQIVYSAALQLAEIAKFFEGITSELVAKEAVGS